MTEEEWRPVKGFEGLYEVSSEGRLRSLPRTVPSTNRWGHFGVRRYKGKILTPTPNEKGYLSVRVCQGRSGGNLIRERIYVHRAVADAFLRNPLQLPQVLHWNDDPGDNRLSNLRWGTQAMNELDKSRNRKG